MNPVIDVHNLGKLYHLGTKHHRRETIFSTLGSWISSPWRNLKQLRRQSSWPVSETPGNTLWALKDISFSVEEGDIVGVIGRNGAGKSTLLKILSRITRPTTGRVDIRGRVSSLLEVGTGFHRDLTGRENIYLNGVLLGMKKHEIDRKFDEIVSFAEVEPFIDTPVKRYSSGMKVRLAFGVAAHLEPEILLVDEVLAVGDAAFQSKCLGKMSDVSQQGRTVMFVSHSMAAIRQLCTRAVVIRQGKLVADGKTDDMIDGYLASLDTSKTENTLDTTVERLGNGKLQFTRVSLEDRDGRRLTHPISGEPVTIQLAFEAKESMVRVTFLMTIYNQYGVAVSHFSVVSGGNKFKVDQGRGITRCHIPRLPLPLGRYRIDIAAFDEGGRLDSIVGALFFDITSSRFFSTFYTPKAKFSTALIDHHWTLEQ
jgi:lipopolysaccharide transport system ATP-binding protein